jgi:ABC-type Mn2+/Zn2+ transport system permease subunit/Mn-dependent DtxR family transcriptional regulator
MIITSFFSDVLSQPWAYRALFASCMVGAMCGALGSFIVLRNMSLIGDALSHAILPGVVFAFMIFGYSVIGFFTGSVVAGIMAALAITWIQQNSTTKNDAAIGIVFTAMFSIGVIGISWISHHEGVHLDLKDFLFGNVLGVSDIDIWLSTGVLIFVLASVLVFYRYLFASTFQPIVAAAMGISVNAIHYFLMLLLSFTIVASLQTVGVILVVAMLISPAATALLLANRLPKVILLSTLIGILSCGLGLVLSILFETTPGPVMTLVATIFYLLAILFSPSKGLVRKFLTKRSLDVKIQYEDVLKSAYQLNKKSELTLPALQASLSISPELLQKKINLLNKKGWLYSTDKALRITDEGKFEAKKLIRAHRLWETYLVEKLGLNESQIHDDAEQLEHLFSEAFIDEIDQTLGYPEIDPHGSPIPQIKVSIDAVLSQFMIDDQVRILDNQRNEHVSTLLWKLKLLPNEVVAITQKDEDQLLVIQNQQKIYIPRDLADKIIVEQSKKV